MLHEQLLLTFADAQSYISGDEDVKTVCSAYADDLARMVRTLNYVFPQEGADLPDAVVVGTGLAGLSAALTVLDRGGQVVLVDKEAAIGGNSAKASSGINACCPHNDTWGDSKESFYADTTRSAGDRVRPDLVEVLVDGSEAAVAWLKSRAGVDLSMVAQLGGHSAKRTNRPKNGMAGAEIVYGMGREVKKYEKLGMAEIILGARVTELVTGEDGAVRGVRVDSQGGDERVVEAGTTILATGGFASDRSSNSYLDKHRPELMSMPATAGSFSTGDGISLASKLGATTVDMEKVRGGQARSERLWIGRGARSEPDGNSTLLKSHLVSFAGSAAPHGLGGPSRPRQWHQDTRR